MEQSPTEPPAKTAKTTDESASDGGAEQEDKDYKDYPGKKDTTNMTFDEKQQ